MYLLGSLATVVANCVVSSDGVVVLPIGLIVVCLNVPKIVPASVIGEVFNFVVFNNVVSGVGVCPVVFC